MHSLLLHTIAVTVAIVFGLLNPSVLTSDLNTDASQHLVRPSPLLTYLFTPLSLFMSASNPDVTNSDAASAATATPASCHPRNSRHNWEGCVPPNATHIAPQRGRSPPRPAAPAIPQPQPPNQSDPQTPQPYPPPHHVSARHPPLSLCKRRCIAPPKHLIRPQPKPFLHQLLPPKPLTSYHTSRAQPFLLTLPTPSPLSPEPQPSFNQPNQLSPNPNTTTLLRAPHPLPGMM